MASQKQADSSQVNTFDARTSRDEGVAGFTGKPPMSSNGQTGVGSGSSMSSSQHQIMSYKAMQ